MSHRNVHEEVRYTNNCMVYSHNKVHLFLNSTLTIIFDSIDKLIEFNFEFIFIFMYSPYIGSLKRAFVCDKKEKRLTEFKKFDDIWNAAAAAATFKPFASSGKFFASKCLGKVVNISILNANHLLIIFVLNIWWLIQSSKNNII